MTIVDFTYQARNWIYNSHAVAVKIDDAILRLERVFEGFQVLFGVNYACSMLA
jgi:hypothetical protein